MFSKFKFGTLEFSGVFSSNTFDPWLVEPVDVETVDMGGCLSSLSIQAGIGSRAQSTIGTNNIHGGSSPIVYALYQGSTSMDPAHLGSCSTVVFIEKNKHVSRLAHFRPVLFKSPLYCLAFFFLLLWDVMWVLGCSLGNQPVFRAWCVQSIITLGLHERKMKYLFYGREAH